MSQSIDELDATVRAFYEGRGETVCNSLFKASSEYISADLLSSHSKSKPKRL
jgi:hypothetical protein